MPRDIRGLRHVELLPARPRCIPPARGLTGTRAAGLAYERKFGKELRRWYSGVHSGQWLRWHAESGFGYAQPDHYILNPSAILLFECKLSETRDAWEQLARYAALLGHLYQRPVLSVQVCKHLRFTRNPLREPTLAQSLQLLASSSNRPLLHWLGT